MSVTLEGRTRHDFLLFSRTCPWVPRQGDYLSHADVLYQVTGVCVDVDQAHEDTLTVSVFLVKEPFLPLECSTA